MPNGWERLPYRNPLEFKNHPLEGAFTKIEIESFLFFGKCTQNLKKNNKTTQIEVGVRNLVFHTFSLYPKKQGWLDFLNSMIGVST